MFELRCLKMGDRPVTGQGNREAVQDFFTRNMDNAPPADTEQHRPEAVLVEVQGLVERRPVTSMLQSLGFRRSLENSLRGAFNQLSCRTNPPARAATAPPPGRQSAVPSRGQNARIAAALPRGQNARVAAVPPRQQPMAPSTRESTQVNTTAPIIPAPPVLPSSFGQDLPAVVPAEPTALSLATSQLPPPPSAPERAQQWLQAQPDPHSNNGSVSIIVN